MSPPSPSSSLPPTAGCDAASRALLELEGVAIATRDDPTFLLVEGIDWAVARDDFWVVAGLPACGKSQLLETAAGLLPPERGTHRWFGCAARAMTREEFASARHRIGLVFPEGGRLFAHLTVAQNVGLPLCYHRECGEESVATRVEQLLAGTGLAPYAHWPPARLNRTWRQRVALVRALALEPDVLLLDNPLSGLDARQATWWLEFLAGLAAGHPLLAGKRVALAVTTDDLRPWVALGRQFALIKDRRWLALGGPRELAASRDPLLREMLAGASVDY